MQITRTLIVDNNAGFRRRVSEFVASEPDIEVLGEAADGEQAIRKAKELQPDVVLMDVRMPGTNGLDATRQLKNEMPKIKVIIKKSLIEELLPAIRWVVSEQLNVTGGGRDDPKAT